MDSTLQSLGLPRKTIGINVTQIGLDDVRVAATALTSLQRCAVTTCVGRIRIPADSRRPSAVSRDAATLSLLAWLFVSHAHRTTHCSFGDRIDCVSDFEVEMVQVCSTLYLTIWKRLRPSNNPQRNSAFVDCFVSV